MKKRKITVNIDTTYKYIQLWNGIFNLTDKELTILSSFIDVNSITEEVNMCSVRNKKEVSSMVGLKDYKGALVVSNNTYKLNTFLTPDADAIEILINRS